VLFRSARLIASGLQSRKLPAKVVVAEAGRLDYLMEPAKGTAPGDQIRAFWSPSSPYYLGKTPDPIARVISSHSYFTTWPLPRQIEIREKLRQHLRRVDPRLAYWQTEFCILETNDEVGRGWGRDLGMDTALYVARVIHSDLTIAEASHWSWWLGVSGADYKDGLVYIEAEKSSSASPGDDPLMHDGRVLPSKTLWALGNFSRFVRPGMVRVGVRRRDALLPLDAARELMISAYLDKKARRLVIVSINTSREEIRLSIENLSKEIRFAGKTLESYTTSEADSLRRRTIPADRISIPPRAILTLVGEMQR